MMEGKIRESEILRLKTENNTITLQAIGDQVGCTKERVRQVLKKHAIGTSWEAKRGYARSTKCNQCSNVFDTIHFKLKGLCRECTMIKRNEAHDSIRKIAVCPKCTSEFQIRKKDPRVLHAAPNDPFCSYRCAALYNDVGTKYGFGAISRK